MNKIMLAFSVSFLMAVVISLTVTGCEPQGEQIEPTIDRVGEDLVVRVYFYDNTRGVTEMYRKLHNIPRGNPMPNKLGFAMWPEWRGPDGEARDRPPDELYECEIHTIRPRLVDDNATMTLGHELLHCLYGSYHQDHWGR